MKPATRGVLSRLESAKTVFVLNRGCAPDHAEGARRYPLPLVGQEGYAPLNSLPNRRFWHLILGTSVQGRRQNFAPGGGARARGARVPKFVVTKSSRSESHLVLGLQKRIWLEIFLQQPATVTGDFGGLTSS